MPERPKKACVNCHFLQMHRASTTGGADRREIPQDERERLKEENIYDWLNSETKAAFALHCREGYWDEGYKADRDPESRFERLVKTNREGKCAFLEFEPGMQYEAAKKELERKEAKERRQNRGRSQAWYGVIERVTASLLTIGSTFLGEAVLSFLTGVDISMLFLEFIRWVAHQISFALTAG